MCVDVTVMVIYAGVPCECALSGPAMPGPLVKPSGVRTITQLLSLPIGATGRKRRKTRTHSKSTGRNVIILIQSRSIFSSSFR